MVEGVDANIPGTEGVRPKERDDFLRGKVEELLGVPAPEINWRNIEPYLAGKDRFLYGFAQGNFIKIGGDFGNAEEPPREQLKRESLGMQLASTMRFPVIEIQVPYTELGTGQREALLAIRKLTFEEGLLLASNEQVAVAPAELGARTARGLTKTMDREIPEESNTSVLKRGDWRSCSPDTFRKVWNEEMNGVLKEEYAQERDQIVDGEKLKEIVEEGEETIEEFLGRTPSSEKEYLVHNDLAPNNVFMANGGEMFFLDWEHAGATHYENLALLADMTNFWSRCWPNPEMQREFIKSYYEEAIAQGLNSEETYSLLKVMVIHGSLFLAKYGMEKDHPEHQMAVMLLQNLEGNLEFLEETKEEIISSENGIS